MTRGLARRRDWPDNLSTQDEDLAQRIGELLVSQGRISQEILSRALELQSFNEKGLRLGGILLKWGLMGEEEILEILGRVHHCPFVGWKVLEAADSEALKLLSPHQAERLRALPYAIEERAVKVAFVNPSDLAAVDEVSFIVRRRVKPSVAMEVRLLQAQQRLYGLGVSAGVWSVLQRIERMSKKRRTGPQKPTDSEELSDTAPISSTTPVIPSPELSPAEDLEPALRIDSSTNLSPPVSLLEPAVPAGPPDAPDDPFSDQFSLERFIGDAIDFFNGLPNLKSDILDEPVEDLDPATVEFGAPLRSTRMDLNSTAPSRPRPRAASPRQAFSF